MTSTTEKTEDYVCNEDLDKLTKGMELYGGDAYATMKEYKRTNRFDIRITYKRAFLEKMMSVHGMDIPRKWIDKGMIYGEASRTSWVEYKKVRDSLIRAFNYHAYYEMEKKFIEKETIIDIPFWKKKHYHRMHYIRKWDGKFPVPTDWDEASEEFIYDINIDEFCEICTIAHGNKKEEKGEK